METFGGFLRELRQGRSLTLGQLALRSGLNKTTLSRWEKGTYYPRIPELFTVLRALNAPSATQATALSLLDAPRALYAERNSAELLNCPLRLSLGDLFFGLRQRSGKTQSEVARAAGVSRALYSQWENDATQPTTSQIHAAGFALGASAEEAAALSCRPPALAPLEKSREALLRCYMATMKWHLDTTPTAYALHLLSLLANFACLVKSGKASIGDVALIIADQGDCAEMWQDDLALRDAYHKRARLLAAQSREPIHFHLVNAVRSLLDTGEGDEKTPNAPCVPTATNVREVKEWQPRFRDNAGQAFFLASVASAIAVEAPDEALRLADHYCDLVADNPDEYPCRLRDRGNLLLKCGRPAESVAFIAGLTPPDGFREGLRQLEMASGLVALRSTTEARSCLTEGKRVLTASGCNYPKVTRMVRNLERNLA